MRSPMEKGTFLDFYKNTVLGYSNGVMSNICTLLVDKNKITFESQRSLGDSEDLLYFESKRDFKKVITETTTNIKFANFYENWEFTKLYKYSLPLFWEIEEKEVLENHLKEIGGKEFIPDEFTPKFVLDTSLKEATPLYWVTDEAIFIKFVLQKSYIQPETFDQIDYRYPIVIYIDLKNGFLEIRYDANRYNSNGIVSNEAYESIVTECIGWLKNNLHVRLYTCNHTFNQAEDVKALLLHYLDDKEVTARYPYIYIKWIKPVESKSYIVRVTFDYFSDKYTLLQHITGGCKDLGMERMNDAIKYLCKSGSFIKGLKLPIAKMGSHLDKSIL